MLPSEVRHWDGSCFGGVAVSVCACSVIWMIARPTTPYCAIEVEKGTDGYERWLVDCKDARGRNVLKLKPAVNVPLPNSAPRPAQTRA